MTASAPTMLRCTRAEALDIDQTSHADELMDQPCDRWVRCIDIAAEPDLVYRWLCQLTIAPYSIDLLDNLGRRSPPVPGAGRGCGPMPASRTRAAWRDGPHWPWGTS
ncbi:MAG: hypothetical protein ACTHV2_10500 [Brachybacterium sp.]|uniref:hypothetical protein n=1 Tax=Brachybacterium sp. TaxID=1891286 RepID=UPI00264EE133|nr:hypothetical protein [Brachybacterium sp.]MDN6329171.1 hypothetical protein [Brachybacterium sp.]MDN6400868.1 hypothetical protein [Brachybacterium sp.]